MKLRSVLDADVANKKVLVRVDYNVELDEHHDVKEKYKVRASKNTIDFLLSRGAHVALLTHLGRPDGKKDEAFSVRHIADDVERILNRKISFNNECVGDDIQRILQDMSHDTVLLLENVRFHAEDEQNDRGFSQALAAPFDMFVNDAFSVCHRDQASVTGLVEFLPSFAGLHLLEEIDHLSRIKDQPTRPAVAVIGGAKIETKLPVIRMFEEKYDKVLVGGKVACEAQDKGVEFSSKVILPSDYALSRWDIGPNTTRVFHEELLKAKTVVWNGPLGKFEEPEYAVGTRMVLDSIVEEGIFSVVGGGETIIALEEANALQKISFVSTGGGAMLEFLAGESLPGLDALLA